MPSLVGPRNRSRDGISTGSHRIAPLVFISEACCPETTSMLKKMIPVTNHEQNTNLKSCILPPIPSLVLDRSEKRIETDHKIVIGQIPFHLAAAGNRCGCNGLRGSRACDFMRRWSQHRPGPAGGRSI